MGGPLPSPLSPLSPTRKRRQYRMTGGVSDPPQPGAMQQRHLSARTASCDSVRLVTGAAIACPYQAADGTWSRQLITSFSQGSCHGRERDHSQKQPHQIDTRGSPAPLRAARVVAGTKL